MLATVVGISRVDYVSRKTERPVKGMKVAVTFPDPDYEGVDVYNSFVSAGNEGYWNLMKNLTVGEVVQFEYNKFGQGRLMPVE